MIVLTGGAGFIGSCFLRKLNNEGIKDILVVDNLADTDKWKNLVGKKYLQYLHKDDFHNMLFEGHFSSDIDTIIHFGACSATTEKNVDYLMQNNFNYSRDLAEYCLDNDAKFIYASSAATYGDGSNGYNDNIFDELKPLNAYGFSKHIFDIWVKDNELEDKLVGLKFFNVFGPNEYHKIKMSSMVLKSFNQIKSTGKVSLFSSNSDEYADGEQMRDFIYVKDVNEIVWKLLNSEIHGIFNIGTGKARSWNDLVKAVFNAANIHEHIEYIDMPDELKNQYQNFTEADMQKLKDAGIDYKFPTLEESITDYVQNHLIKNFENY